MSGYKVVRSADAPDLMAEYPGFGEMRFFAEPAETEQVAFTWRLLPPGTGGRGSYGHRHKTQEEIYFVVKGTLTFKLDDDVFEIEPRTAVRISPEVYRSVHNDTDADVELVICSVRSDEPDHETTPDFWPEEA
jgi:mannose-6-phosphate isomerase-like protein (cupin superfamily)